MRKIVSNYTGSDSWYRIWSDGFIEQGGKVRASISTSGIYTFTFPIPFISAPISIDTTTIASGSSNSQGNELTIKSGTLTATGVQFINDGYGTSKTGFYWTARGY